MTINEQFFSRMIRDGKHGDAIFVAARNAISTLHPDVLRRYESVSADMVNDVTGTYTPPADIDLNTLYNVFLACFYADMGGTQ